ncbi:MAG: hypothetical protein Q7S84_03120 [bacterium]|nr:hypothetical protein [bacterium]
MKKQIITSVVAAVVFGAVGFWTGMSYGKSLVTAVPTNLHAGGFLGASGGGTGTGGPARTTDGVQSGGQRFVGRGAAGMGGGTAGGFLAGEVVSKDASSVTVKLRDGGSRVVFISTSTQVLASRPGTLNDVMVGEELTIQGITNADGSISAQSIQVRPNAPPGQ